SDANKAAVRTDIAAVRGDLIDVPLVIEKFEIGMNVEPAARRNYIDFVARTAPKDDTTVIVWDNGLSDFDLNTHSFRESTAIYLLLHVMNGMINSLADPATYTSATTQSSTAFVFQKVGDELADQILPFLLNRNTINYLQTTDGIALSSNEHTVANDDINLTSALVSKCVSNDAAPGSKENLTFTFSAGPTVAFESMQ
ncbi:uncharacterized protein BCR38DRAFT_506910, partial [Pseudomassariella vexata]